MPTVEPSKTQHQQQHRVPQPQPPNKKPPATDTPRDPNDANVVDSATLERIQKGHLGSRQDEHRKHPHNPERRTIRSIMPSDKPTPTESSPAAPARPPPQWKPIEPPTSGPATRGYGHIDPRCKDPTCPSNSTGVAYEQ